VRKTGNEKPSVQVMDVLDTSALAWCGEAALVSVEEGRGALRQVMVDEADSGNDYMAHMALTLHGQPLVLGRMPGCSTCESLLAAGYGIESAAELSAVGERLNNGMDGGIVAAVDTLAPILGLLEDGLYAVADVPHCPTDGSGRFFWDVPSEMTAYPATAMALSYDFHCTPGVPTFLYPSQMPGKYDEARVRHYMEQLRQGARFLAVAYHLCEFMSVLLDGHHKAAAAALLGERVHCLTIIPLTSVVFDPPYTPTRRVVQEFNFAGIRVERIPAKWKKWVAKGFGSAKKAALAKGRPAEARIWEPAYAEAAKWYPTAAQMGQSAGLKLSEITDEAVESRLSDPSGEGVDWLMAALSVLALSHDDRLKPLALRCAKPGNTAELRAEAFRVLASLTDDADAEQVFIDYLVEENDSYSALRRIAEDYFRD
jgi:hypothetical protein